MRRLTFLLRPGWLILAAVVAAFAYLCFTVLAPWQLGKNTRTEHRNQLITDSVSAAPVPIGQLVGAKGASSDHEWRRVVAGGDYVPGSTVLVRLRSVNDNPAYEVLAALRLDDGRTVLVDRGYALAVEGTKPPKINPPPAGHLTVLARIRMSEGVVPGKPPRTEDGYRQVYSVDSGQVATVMGIPLVPGYLQLAADQPGSYQPIPLPQLASGPYLSYGLQWLAFGVMAPLGLAYFVRSELMERRKHKAAKPPVEPAVPSPPPPPPTKEAKLADRYGKTR